MVRVSARIVCLRAAHCVPTTSLFNELYAIHKIGENIQRKHTHGRPFQIYIYAINCN